jgi:hypothetical protein
VALALGHTKEGIRRGFPLFDWRKFVSCKLCEETRQVVRGFFTFSSQTPTTFIGQWWYSGVDAIRSQMTPKEAMKGAI